MSAAAILSTAWAGLALAMRPASRLPTRVGLLNTGELVLVDCADHAQVLSAPTTALIRQQLMHTEFADSELVLFPADREAREKTK